MDAYEQDFIDDDDINNIIGDFYANRRTGGRGNPVQVDLSSDDDVDPRTIVEISSDDEAEPAVYRRVRPRRGVIQASSDVEEISSESDLVNEVAARER